MAKKYYTQNRFAKKREGYRGALITMLPPVLMVGLVPLIVRQFDYENGLTNYAWFGSSTISIDFFLAWKSMALMVLAFIMAGCVLARLWKEKRELPFVKVLIPLLGYGLLVLLSACVSVNKKMSFAGGFEQFETVWALLSYVLVVYYVFLYATSELELQVVTDALCCGISVIGILGTFQGIGLDLFSTTLYQKLITKEAYLQSVGGHLGTNFTENYAVVTLYNPNYVGVFGSLVVPFLAMMLVFEKNKWRRIWHGGNLMLVLVTLLSSRSRAGLIAAVIAICVALAFAIRKLFKWWYLAIPAVNLAIVLVLLVNAYNDGILFRRLQNILKPDQAEVVEVVSEDGTVVRKSGLTEMYTTTSGVVLTYNDVTMQATLYSNESSYGFYAVERSGEQLELDANEKGTEFTFQHPALTDIKLMPVTVGERLGMCINIGKEDWYFVYNDYRGSFQYITATGKESDMIMAEGIGFERYQTAFSGRGYIWSRTIPLLKDHIFLGSGPDTFILEYPQNDYMKMREHGYDTSVMTKPHSWYLQVGVQTGVLSLVCLVVFYGWYAVQSIRLYAFRKLTTQTEAFGIAAFIGSIGYMISGISNDSMVVTAPVFWGIIGVGVAANVMVKKSRVKEKAEKQAEKQA